MDKTMTTTDKPLGTLDITPVASEPASAGDAPVVSRATPLWQRTSGIEDVGPVGASSRRWSLPRPPAYLTTFILFVVLPSIAYGLYLFSYAADQYVAEARFAIRNSQTDLTVDFGGTTSTGSSAGSVLTSVSLAGQDAYVVASYVRSPAIFADLDPTVSPRDIFSRPEADYFTRLPAGASDEEIVDYWRKMVETYIDGPSGVVVVKARAFRQRDARDLVSAIVDASEHLVNRMSQRIHDDAMNNAKAELQRAETMLRDALDAMSAYRNEVGYITPDNAAASTSQLLLGVMTEKMQLENDYFTSMRALSPNAPTVLAQKSRLDALDQQINKLKGEITGAGKGNTSISASLARYEELEMNRAFAAKLYDLAVRSLEHARQSAEQQGVYLVEFVPPMVPEEASYPRRIAQSILFAIGILILWGIFALLAATVEDHMV